MHANIPRNAISAVMDSFYDLINPQQILLFFFLPRPYIAFLTLNLILNVSFLVSYETTYDMLKYRIPDVPCQVGCYYFSIVVNF